MKYILCLVGAMFVCVSIFLFGGRHNMSKDDYLRIHIIANSNDVEDQKIKYDVKDEIAKYLSVELENLKNCDEAMRKIEEKLPQITQIANNTLNAKGVIYSAKCFLSQEEVPARIYDNLFLESGRYETLVVKLGKAMGDNWWCVVFPNVCFAD